MSKQSLFKSLLSLSLLLSLAACLPATKPATSTAATTDSILNLDSSGAAADGAKAPCTRYDTSTATRSVCVSCYQSILSTRCPGKSEFASCLDTTVKTGYITLVNQCVSQSTQAGFTCTTTCSAGLVLNPTNCTCVLAPPTAGSGTPNVDVGQTDFGPPIIRASIPSASIVGVMDGGSCVGTLPLYMGVQNRGNTVFRLNGYSDPTIDSAQPVVYLTEAKRPVIMSTSETAEHPGNNVRASVKFTTRGVTELTSSVGGRVGSITTVSGANSDGSNFNDGTTEGAGTPGSLATDMAWSAPGFGARDKDGNLYFSDPLAHVVDVICYNPKGPGLGSPFCDSVDAGKVVRVAGLSGQAGYMTDLDGNDIEELPEGELGYEVKLNSPHGIAVHSNYDVYIADSGNHIIRRVLAANKRISRVAGVVQTPSNALGSLHFPYGVDLDIDGGRSFIYIADYQNHRIVRCDFATCLVYEIIAGNGTAGHRTDAQMNSTFNATSNPALNFPTDIKANWNGNVLYADSRNHLIRGICFLAGAGDFCQDITAAGGAVVTVAGKEPIAGVPQPGDSGEGIAANRGLITYPTQLLIAKQFSDDTLAAGGFGAQKFRDNNIVFTERLLGGSLFNGVPSPTAVKDNTIDLSGINAMHMGIAHTCFLKTNGDPVCIGNNSVNQIGSATASNPQTRPLDVQGVSVSGGLIGGGSHHTCAINGSGSEMKCWGFNNAGQLGHGTAVPEPVPVAVISPTGVAAPQWNLVDGGDAHTCGIDLTGADKIWCWGANNHGQLGLLDNDFTPLTQPAVPVDDPPAGSIVPVWMATGANFTCAVYADFLIKCWGDNSSGQLGNNGVALEAPGAAVRDKVAAANLTFASFTGVTAGGSHACAWRSAAGGSREIFCWGSNAKGELGIGSVSDSEKEAVAVVGIQAEIGEYKVAAGIAHTCAISGVFVYCWGDNSSGQLGNEDVPMSTVPLAVVGLPAGTPTAIYAKGNQTCALIGGKPYCWGNNQFKQLGSATTSINPSGNVVRIICGDNTIAGDIVTAGLCAGVPKPTLAAGTPAGLVAQGSLFTIAGKTGKAGNRGSGDGGNARAATFGKVTGLTYDLYKNIVVSSGGFLDAAGQEHTDFSLRRITQAVVGASSGVKFTVTDSNNLSSYWCLRLKPLTACDSAGTCSCAMLPPTDEAADPEFWKSIASTTTCN